MKLRIRENSIRLRLKQSEVEQLASGQGIAEQTRFPDSVLIYRLVTAETGATSASFSNGELTVTLLKSEVVEWAQTDQVSIIAEQALEQDEALSILVEKDFQCLAPGDHRLCDDDHDTYPHPNAGSENGC
jgi:hypothetical protein